MARRTASSDFRFSQRIETLEAQLQFQAGAFPDSQEYWHKSVASHPNNNALFRWATCTLVLRGVTISCETAAQGKAYM